MQQFIEVTRSVADVYVCLGDVVNYGPWNDECLELVAQLPGIIYLKCNHEDYFLDQKLLKNEPPLVRIFYEHSIRFFSRKNLITNLPGSYLLEKYLCAHTIGNQRIYKDTDIEIDRDHMIGHSHHQFVIERSGRKIISPGSIGQKRDQIDKINYALFDTGTGEIELCEQDYDFDSFCNELVAREYPLGCIEYYTNKKAR